MNKQKIIDVLKTKGFSDNQITSKVGGVEIVAEKRVPMYEFDYNEFLVMFIGEMEIDKSKFHMLDQWTFTIECE